MSLLALPVALLVLFLAFSLGNFLLRRLRLPPMERLVFSSAVGFAFVSMAVFLLASLGQLNASAAWALVLLPLLFLLPQLKENLVFFHSLAKDGARFFRKLFRSKLGALFSIVLFLLLAMQFLSALAPPASATPGPKDWDSLVYHFAVAKTFVLNGGFVQLPLPHANWPLGIEMLHALSFLLDSVVTAKLLTLAIGGLLLLALYAFAREFLPPEKALVAPLLFSTIPLAQAFWGTGYVDLPLAFFELLAAWAFLKWWEHESWDWLLLSAVLAGFSAAVKTIGGFVVVLLVFGLAYKLVRSSSKKSRWHHVKEAVVFGAVACLFFLPWYLKTWLWTGNPTWPLYFSFYSLLGFSSAGTAYFNLTLHELTSVVGTGQGVLDFLALPFSLTFLGAKFNGVVSPLFLAFLPLLYFVRPIPGKLKALLVFTAMFAGLWFFNFQDARFFFPALTFLSLPAAYAYGRLEKGKGLGRALKLSLAGMLVFVLLFTFVYKSQSFGVALGLESSQAYLLRAQSNYGALDWANRNLPASSKLFFFRDQQGFYANLPYEYFSDWDFSQFPDAESLGLQLKAQGFTHVLVNANNGLSQDARGERQGALVGELLKKHGRLLYAFNGVSLYALAS